MVVVVSWLLPGGRYGGIMSPSGKSFGYGGIASGPQSGYQQCFMAQRQSCLLETIEVFQ